MKMKPVLVLLLALCLMIGLCACGSDNKGETEDKKNQSSAATSGETTAPAETEPSQSETEPSQSETEPSQSETAPSDTTDPSESNNASSTNTTAAPTQPVDGKANYTVIVTDEAGNPMPGVFVQICLEACIPCMTNAQGVASYPNMAVENYKVSIISFPDGYTVDTNEFYFAADTYEMTIVLKAAN